MNAIESKENFSKEVSGILVKIKEQVDTYSNSVSTGGDINETDVVSKINVLKKYDFILKPIPLNLEKMSEEDWIANKAGLQKTYTEAQEALNTIIKA